MNDEENMKDASPLAFEQAFSRLEEILEKLNSSEISLDESLKLYEEADKLIRICNQRLTDAENRIELLVKNRQGEVVMENGQKPLTQSFNLSNNNKNS